MSKKSSDIQAANEVEFKRLTNLLKNGSLTNATTTRLKSFTPPRDLTLGGLGRPSGVNIAGAATSAAANANAAKKVFVPNLNVVRNKNINVKTSKDMTAKQGRGRGRGGRSTRESRNDRKNNLIQTTGVFSEGAGALQKPMVNHDYSYGRSGGGEDSGKLAKPVLVKSEYKNSIQNTKRELSVDLSDILSDDIEPILPIDKTDLHLTPVKLEEHIKKEQQQHEVLDDHKMLFRPESATELFSAKMQRLFLVQFPEELPFEDAVEEKPKHKITHEIPSESATDSPQLTADDTNKEIPTSRNPKRSIPNGRVGSLLRYKSGAVKLKIGNMLFDVDMGLDTGISQDLMSIFVSKEEGEENTLINLGPLESKLTVSPDWNVLLKQCDTK